jgi:hypothetical protein
VSEGPAAGDASRAFLSGLIDYAGLFPPASLDVPAAVAEYARHRSEAEVWMLGRFIAPAARLVAVCEAAQRARVTETWEYSLLVGDGSDPDGALAAVADHGRITATCEDRFPARVAALETPLPREGAGAATAEFGPRLRDALVAAGLKGRELYLEVPAGVDDAASIRSLKDLTDPDLFPLLGAKLRCGGVQPEAFPSVERVAAFILACRGFHLPLKCTAGLHHPVRHRASDPDVMMHGFLNVFGAGVLAYGGLLDPARITACVAETDPAAFALDGAGFTWRDHHVDAATVAAARRDFLGGFGSCSFAEPRSDLQDLKIL